MYKHWSAALGLLLMGALLLMAVLLELAGEAQRHMVAAPPAMRLLPAVTVAPAGPGSVVVQPDGTALIRFFGMTVLAGNVKFPAAMPAAPTEGVDLIVLPQVEQAQLDWLGGLARRGGAVAGGSAAGRADIVAAEAAAARLRQAGVAGVRALPLWQALELRKGKVALRLTAMPGRRTAELRGGFMLDFSSGRAFYRIYVSGEAMAAEDVAELPQRFPGAQLALLQADDAPILATLQDDTGGASLQLLPGARYAFTPLRR
ncbi:hypothetical protein [Rugamonas sp. DEMB1]|uniref:hypothetical protein n=1 Tax=Rugamonas sp. DEMB1 TaxID=3039386 RepID=UPI00244992CF|nr:hypothetical protein [Rugamonas sp. DEMB1]WGG50821.1 hypothetical protein QC826_00420 [Rugamonas sp. DEMB1]